MKPLECFDPDWVSPPGDTILALGARHGLSRKTLAKSLEMDFAAFEELLEGRRPLDAPIAEQLALTLGASKSFWVNRYSRYQDSLLSAALKLQREVKFPLADMRRFGWISSGGTESEAILAAVNFMGVRSVDEFECQFGRVEEALAFRRSASFDMEIGAVSAWYRAAKIQAESLAVDRWNPEGFSACLSEVRRFSTLHDPAIFMPKIRGVFSRYGVALCIVPAPVGCPVSGIARFDDGVGLISLSSRHLTDDHFWFSLFHEAAHLLLHGEMISIEVENGITPKEEVEANNFAAKVIIPPEREGDIDNVSLSKFGIARLAKSLGVSPGLIVGQLQYRKKVRFNQFNYLKTRFKWSGVSLEMA
ncbi:ImmA/IrrE family metallo-endopeptidase [Stenotrophomonas sp. PS02297]|uniref:ImmA/IrrE family metallo-endopeptidase n=1 Tax=Stenotrophomonas sp. PS02297 TaxID=2991423 RepID=UPI00249AE733|nr:ImmA/IrrE family metallo-endopeptidase [Stenotrophomonas sp. PS02297]